MATYSFCNFFQDLYFFLVLMCLVRIARSSANVKQSISMLDQPILIINLSNTKVKSNEENPFVAHLSLL